MKYENNDQVVFLIDICKFFNMTGKHGSAMLKPLIKEWEMLHSLNVNAVTSETEE